MKAIKRNRGLPAHAPTLASRKLVQLCLGLGYTMDRTARLLEVSENTLRKYYSAEIEAGADKALTAVAATLFNIAVDPTHPKCATAAIFLLKCRAGWRENAPIPDETEAPTTFTINIGNLGPSGPRSGNSGIRDLTEEDV